MPIFGLGLEPTIYRTQGENANYYTTGEVLWCDEKYKNKIHYFHYYSKERIIIVFMLDWEWPHIFPFFFIVKSFLNRFWSFLHQKNQKYVKIICLF